MAKKEPKPRLRHSVWMQAELPLSFRQRLRVLLGASLSVQLTMPTERSPGRTGQVRGMILVGRMQPKATETTDGAAEPGGPGGAASGG